MIEADVDTVNLPHDVHGVNIYSVNTSDAAGQHRYHHGDLRNALVEAAVELAREGGPTAIVLREAARRVGVSPNAAYRHFAALPDLANAVADVAMTAIATAMLEEQARFEPTEDIARNAMQNLLGIGRGYVRFALAEPGLFAAAFINPKEPQAPAHDDGPMTNPGVLLQRTLDGLIAAGLLDPESRPYASATAWAGVHGLSTLLLGPMSAVPVEERPAFIDACLHMIAYGLVTRDDARQQRRIPADTVDP